MNKVNHSQFHDFEKKLQIIRELHHRAKTAVFAHDPYIKFLPLIFCPPRLDWTLAKPCAVNANRLMVVPAFGRDLLARQGWLGFAYIAIFSLLCCHGIEKYAVELLVSDHAKDLGKFDFSELFPSTRVPDYKKLARFNVRIRTTSEPLSTSKLYDFYGREFSTIIRVDADSGFIRKNCPPDYFSYSYALGESGLNYRHTQRNSYDQLFHPADGRMRSWEKPFQKRPGDFLTLASDVISNVFGFSSNPGSLKDAMKIRHWPSEGLSYMDTQLLKDYRLLRDALQESQVVPTYDEEIIKLLLACVLDVPIECAQIPVLEYWELNQTFNNVVVNFRNIYRLSPMVNHLLSDNRNDSDLYHHLNYVFKFVEEICTS